jgi:hypothetical protein
MKLLRSIGFLLLGGAVQAQGFSANHMFVSSQGTNTVFEFDENANFVQQFGPEFGLTAPRGLAFGPEGDLYVASSAAGGSVFQITLGVSGPAALVKAWGVGNLTNPRSVAFGAGGSLYVGTDTGIVEISTSDAVVRTISNAGVVNTGIFGYGANDQLYTANNDATVAVAQFDPSGAFVGNTATTFPANLVALTVKVNGNVLAADSSATQNVIEIDGTGANVNSFSPAQSVNCMTIGPNGKLFAGNTADQIVTLANNGVATGVVTAAAGLMNPQGIAFAPFRFQGKITGTLAQPGLANKNPNQKVNVSMSPGSGTVMIQIVQNTNNQPDLTDVFGATSWVFHGFQVDTSANNKIELQGSEESTNSVQGGVGSIAVDVTGKTVGQGYFTIKKGTATVHRASASGILNGKLSTSKLINND